MSEHLPRFTLERLAARDLADADLQKVRVHTEGCATCRSTVEAVAGDQALFTAEIPYAAFRVEHEKRRGARHGRGRRRMLWLPGLAVTAALVVALPLALEDASRERLKGPGVALSFAVLDAQGLRLGQVGETLTSGARLQVAYDAGTHSHMAVLGVDGRGEVTVYFPQADALAPLPAGRAGALPFSLTLDDTPGAERFVVVFADGALPLAPLVDVMRHVDPYSGAGLRLPSGATSASVWILKQ